MEKEKLSIKKQGKLTIEKNAPYHLFLTLPLQ